MKIISRRMRRILGNLLDAKFASLCVIASKAKQSRHNVLWIASFLAMTRSVLARSGNNSHNSANSACKKYKQ